MSVRTVIIDDHALVGAGIEAVLSEQAGGRFDVVGATTIAADAVALVEAKQADLALVDLHMPPPGGVEAIRQIRAARPQCRVVAVSGDADVPTVIEALAAGASAFLPKTLGPAGLVAPLQTIIDGGGVAPAALLGQLAARWSDTAAPAEAPTLDGADRDLVTLLCRGYEVAAMADELHVSPSTVKRRLSALEARLGVSSRLEVAHLAGWYRWVGPAEDEVAAVDEA